MRVFLTRILFFIVEMMVRVLPDSLVRQFLPFDPQRLKSSFAPIRPRIEEFSPIFYQNFWTDYPETRELFGKNMNSKELDQRINHFMLFIVENAHRPRVYMDYVRHLSARHRGYGIFDHQFEFVGETNIKTIRQMVGRLSPEDENAWRASFKFLTWLMKCNSQFKKKAA